MAIALDTDQITADDDAIRKALLDAFLPALIPALAQATGDLSILREDIPAAGLRAGSAPGRDDAGATGCGAHRRVRGAESAPRQLDRCTGRHRVGPANDHAVDDRLGDAGRLHPAAGGRAGPVRRGPERRPGAWTRASRSPWRSSARACPGILAGIRLKQAGVPFVIFEKNADVGGTWLENTYPGARVDVPNAFYSYSFAQRSDWPKHFSPQEVLLDYFRDCADQYGVREHIRFGTEVLSADFDDERLAWTLRLRTPDGEETVAAEAVISAVGQLNRPKMPDIPGIETFAGPSFHSARWDHSVDLKGKRVAVIGTGASAAQFVPAIAGEVAELNVFQRTPAWFVPVPTYHDDVAGRAALAVPPRSALLALVSLLAVLEHDRRPAAGRHGRRELAKPGSLRERPERNVARDADVLPPDRVRRPAGPPRESGARIPADVEADAAGQRRLGEDAEARQRAPDHRQDQGDHAARRRHRGRRGARG